MKRFILLVAVLTACQPASEPVKSPSKNESAPLSLSEPVPSKTSVKAGVVRLRLNAPVSETRACIIPISIENGLESDTSVTMISFGLTGPGNDAKGNMFAPAAGPGKISEARVIVEGQSCEAFDTLTIPEIRCTSGDGSCEEKVELIDGETLRFSRSG